MFCLPIFFLVILRFVDNFSALLARFRKQFADLLAKRFNSLRYTFCFTATQIPTLVGFLPHFFGVYVEYS